MRELISTEKGKKVQAGNKSSNILPKSLHVASKEKATTTGQVCLYCCMAAAEGSEQKKLFRDSSTCCDAEGISVCVCACMRVCVCVFVCV